MSNLDESIGKVLLDLQKSDPETFKKLMQRTQEENPELFESNVDEDNKKIDDYNREVDKYNKKIDEN
ncbi:MAG: hypothetical protein OEM89_11045 [Nitrosopumilus sp.]|nr:hypothetical protein [Nitrosopumilus sp.]